MNTVKSEPEESILPIVQGSLEYEHSTMNTTDHSVAGFTIKEEYQTTEFHDLEQAINEYEGGSIAPPPPASVPDYSDSVLSEENSDSEFMSLAEIKKTNKKKRDSQSTSPDQEIPSTSKRKCLNNDVANHKRGRPAGTGVKKVSTIKMGDKQLQRRYPVAKRPPRLRTLGYSTPPLSTPQRSNVSNTQSVITDIADLMREAVAAMKERNNNALEPNVSLVNYLLSELKTLSDDAAASVRMRVMSYFLQCIQD